MLYPIVIVHDPAVRAAPLLIAIEDILRDAHPGVRIVRSCTPAWLEKARSGGLDFILFLRVFGVDGRAEVRYLDLAMANDKQDDFDFDAVMAPDFEPVPETTGVRQARPFRGRANLATSSKALFESDAESADRENGRAF